MIKALQRATGRLEILYEVLPKRRQHRKRPPLPHRRRAILQGLLLFSTILDFSSQSLFSIALLHFSSLTFSFSFLPSFLLSFLPSFLLSFLPSFLPFKDGMRKDKDGFMDIQWCQQKVITDWEDLRSTFQEANARKAIAPTQFNPQSTRGHCIMVLQLEMPHPDMPGMKRMGRVYVCDLAGTEPAGDVVYAMYKKLDDGEMQFIGPHRDPKKTKELQDQGKKINLSLMEMGTFFKKMAHAVKKKKLKPGHGIPGCNTYFLCKYLKDTMLQARTYLFCATRPEARYQQVSYPLFFLLFSFVLFCFQFVFYSLFLVFTSLILHISSLLHYSYLPLK